MLPEGIGPFRPGFVESRSWVTIPMTARAYFSNLGPESGPILESPQPSILVLYDTADAGDAPIGLAHPAGHIERSGSQVQTYRLAIGPAQLDGLWICEGRRFLRIDGRTVVAEHQAAPITADSPWHRIAEIAAEAARLA